jgi:hypothetical protein
MTLLLFDLFDLLTVFEGNRRGKKLLEPPRWATFQLLSTPSNIRAGSRYVSSRHEN